MDIKKIISEMTLEEKCAFASGYDAWHTPGAERVGVAPIMMCDGPSGLRKRAKINGSKEYNTTVKATCFPSAATQACSWNRELIYEVGKTIATECRSEQVGVLLGPGLNIKRSPLCGRNFEYYSEDPYLAGTLAASFVRGVQSEGVSACAKHFAVNNQETRRHSSSANVDDRTLREIYLRAFEIVVKEAQPDTIMHSYNRINGRQASQSKWLLTDILRDDWGFRGFVMSDWNAMRDRVLSLESGSDLEMPGQGAYGQRDREIYDAVKSGALDEAVLDTAVERILTVMDKLTVDENPAPSDLDANHLIASSLCDECMVLLKNEGKVLPFDKKQPLAVIGEFAHNPRYQGGGSSHVEPYKIDNLLDYIHEYNGEENTVYAQGYSLRDEKPNEAMIAEAVEAAKKCGRALIFAGMPEYFETEGRDRVHMRMPESHNALIRAVCEAVPNTAVVLLLGSPVEMPWLDGTNALLAAYLGGQALGGAITRVVFGDVNPSGKLAETFPKRLEDTPCFLDFPGEYNECNYSEGIFVGYRWYDKRKIQVNFPFGYGLSYTTFAYENIAVEGNKVKVRVKNTGDRAGKEAVQVYVGFVTPDEMKRPVRELRAFDKIELNAGEAKTVEFEMDDRWFSYWCVDNNKWCITAGDYAIYAGPNAFDTPLKAIVRKEGVNEPQLFIDMTTTFGDIATRPCYERVRAFFFDSMFPSKEFADEVAINGHGMKNKHIWASRYLVPRMFVDRRNWPESKIYEIMDEANAILRGETEAKKTELDASTNEQGPSYTF